MSTGENAGATEQITVNPAETTNYTVTVADSFAPTTGDDPSAEATSTVTVNPEITVEVTVAYPTENETEALCQGRGQNATLTANASGGNGNYSYSWINTTTGGIVGTSSQLSVSPDVTAEYSVSVTDNFETTVGGENPSVEASATVMVDNCDITDTSDLLKTFENLTTPLKELALSYNTPGYEAPTFLGINTKDTPQLSDDEIRVDITIINYPDFIAFLGSLPIPISETSLFTVYDPITAELTATAILRISDLLTFDVEPSIQRVSEIFAIPGKIINQGDFAQGSLAGRLGWEVTGANIGIGVISDSYDNKGAAANDVTNNDLPGGTNTDGFTTPVNNDFDFFGGGSDEEGQWHRSFTMWRPMLKFSFGQDFLGSLILLPRSMHL